MKHMNKMFAAALSVLLAFSLAACGSTADTENVAETAAVEAEDGTSLSVTVNADGKQIVIMDADGMTTDELLDKAGITLEEGDCVTVDSGDVLSESITLNVVRSADMAASDRTITSIADYPDCDDSGHGVRVVTYSDGAQEEIPY